MENLEIVPRKYEEAVDLLARWHANGHTDLEVLSFPDPARKIVRLVEISDDFPATGDSTPIRMGASADFPFPSGVILLTKREWMEVQEGKMSMPNGWSMQDAKRIWPN